MKFVMDFISGLFVIISFQTLKKSDGEIRGELEAVSKQVFAIKWLIHIVLLYVFWMNNPPFQIVVIVFFFLQLLFGLWFIINKENYLAIYENVPEIFDRAILVVYIVYFGYNFLNGLLW